MGVKALGAEIAKLGDFSHGDEVVIESLTVFLLSAVEVPAVEDGISLSSEVPLHGVDDGVDISRVDVDIEAVLESAGPVVVQEGDQCGRLCFSGELSQACEESVTMELLFPCGKLPHASSLSQPRSRCSRRAEASRYGGSRRRGAILAGLDASGGSVGGSLRHGVGLAGLDAGLVGPSVVALGELKQARLDALLEALLSEI